VRSWFAVSFYRRDGKESGRYLRYVQYRQKVRGHDTLNDTLRNNGIDVAFPSNYWSFGGEGHMIIAKHFVLGGKGYVFGWEKQVPNSARHIKLTGGMGVGSLGYSINIAENVSNAFRFYPQLGLGLSTFLLQNKDTLTATSTFPGMMTGANPDDRMSVIQKVGLVADVAVGVDWYLKFIHLLSIIPGLETGPMLHFEAGYSITPVTMNWMRDVEQIDYNPNLKFTGFYTSVGIGLAFSTGK
jgi:hypothetical protein